jgi:hypothetical protein
LRSEGGWAAPEGTEMTSLKYGAIILAAAILLAAIAKLAGN